MTQQNRGVNSDVSNAEKTLEYQSNRNPRRPD